MLFRHSFYIHTNFGSAIYLLVFCSFYWLAELERDGALLPVAFLALTALALLGLLAPAPPARWVFVCGVPAYLALILLLVLGRHPYYAGIGDSAVRMAVHLVPLSFFYFGVKFAPLLAGAPGEGT